MIDYGGGLIFPDAWAQGPPDQPEPEPTDRELWLDEIAPDEDPS